MKATNTMGIFALVDEPAERCACRTEGRPCISRGTNVNRGSPVDNISCAIIVTKCRTLFLNRKGYFFGYLWMFVSLCSVQVQGQPTTTTLFSLMTANTTAFANGTITDVTTSVTSETPSVLSTTAGPGFLQIWVIVMAVVVGLVFLAVCGIIAALCFRQVRKKRRPPDPVPWDSHPQSTTPVGDSSQHHGPYQSEEVPLDDLYDNVDDRGNIKFGNFHQQDNSNEDHNENPYVNTEPRLSSGHDNFSYQPHTSDGLPQYSPPPPPHKPTQPSWTLPGSQSPSGQSPEAITFKPSTLPCSVSHFSREDIPERSPPPVPKDQKAQASREITNPAFNPFKIELMNKIPVAKKPPPIVKKTIDKAPHPAPKRIIDPEEVIRGSVSIPKTSPSDDGEDYEDMGGSPDSGEDYEDPTGSLQPTIEFVRDDGQDFGGNYEEMSPASATLGKGGKDFRARTPQYPTRPGEDVINGAGDHGQEYEDVDSTAQTGSNVPGRGIDGRPPAAIPAVTQGTDFGGSYEDVNVVRPPVQMKPRVVAIKPRVVAIKPKVRQKPPNVQQRDFGEEYTNLGPSDPPQRREIKPPPIPVKGNKGEREEEDPIYMNRPNLKATPSELYRNLPSPPQTADTVVGGYTSYRKSEK